MALLLEEYAPEIVYIKGIHNSVADAISRSDYTPTKSIASHFAFMQSLASDYDSDVKQHVKWKAFSHFHNSCEISSDTVGVTTEERHMFLNSCFASRGKEEQEETYPPMIPEIADANMQIRTYAGTLNVGMRLGPTGTRCRSSKTKRS